MHSGTKKITRTVSFDLEWPGMVVLAKQAYYIIYPVKYKWIGDTEIVSALIVSRLSGSRLKLETSASSLVFFLQNIGKLLFKQLLNLSECGNSSLS